MNPEEKIPPASSPIAAPLSPEVLPAASEKQDTTIVPPPQSIPIENDPLSPLQQIRTYQGDVASALHNQKESLVSIQRAEAVKTMEQQRGKRLSPEDELEQKRSRTSGILLFLGIIAFLSLGGAGGFYAYTLYKAKVAVPVAQIIPNAFFGTDSLVSINALSFSREDLLQAIQAERQKNNTTITQVQLQKGDTGSLLTTEEMLTILQSHAPASLVRSFNPLFMLGELGGAPEHTFLLIKLDSYENAFGGMLEWEQNLSLDMLPLFADQETIQTLPSETPFQDITIQNRDARILKDADGKTVLLYSFFDNNVLIVTDNEDSFKSIITRLTSEKLTR